MLNLVSALKESAENLCVYVSEQMDGMVTERRSKFPLPPLLLHRIKKLKIKTETWCLFLSLPMFHYCTCEEVCIQHGVRQSAVIRFTPNTLLRSKLSVVARTFLWNNGEVHLHVDTVMLAGTLMLLLMTANTLMLNSTPASRPEMVQAVVLPGILISNGTPYKETGARRQLVYIYTPFRRRPDTPCLPPALLGV